MTRSLFILAAIIGESLGALVGSNLFGVTYVMALVRGNALIIVLGLIVLAVHYRRYRVATAGVRQTGKGIR